MRGFFPQNGVAQNCSSRPSCGHGCSSSGQVPAGGKTNYCNFIRENMPFFRMGINNVHGLLIILQGLRPYGILSDGIAQNERVVTGFQIGRCHRVSFPVRAKAVTPSRDHQDRRSGFNPAKFSANILHHSGQADAALLV